MTEIPKIIHQVWSGIDGPLPVHFRELGETWKRDYPEWRYEFWDNERMNQFIHDFYPHFWEIYNEFPYNIQRWDAIRYLILAKTGGMYVDFDYESIKPLDEALKEKTCCFASEPIEHLNIFGRNIYINNALMMSIPNHPFMNEIIQKVFTQENQNGGYTSKMEEVLKTTGPIMLSNLLEQTKYKSEVTILPAHHVSPFNKMDARQLLSGLYDENFEEYLENKLEEAFAVHYFIGTWT